MRPVFLFSLLMLLCLAGKSQYINFDRLINQRVKASYEQWLEKDEFETLAEYQYRLSQREAKLNELVAEAINFHKQRFIAKINFENYQVSSYDADAQSFAIDLDPELVGRFYLRVPRDQARNFKDHSTYLRFQNLDFDIDGNQWTLTALEVYDPVDHRTYSYHSSLSTSYNPNRYKQEIASVVSPSIEEKIYYQSSFRSEVALNIPQNPVKKENAIAVVIGNRDYLNRDVPSVDFALADAATMRKYLVQALGFEEKNILFFPNATQATFNTLFGKEGNHKGRLFNLVDPGETEIFVYYSGHGAPELGSSDAYFVPVDCDPSLVQLNGYATRTFFDNLSQIPYRSLTVVIDACFSGGSQNGMLIRNASPVFIKAKNNFLYGDNVQIFSSSAGNQISSWYPSEQHSLFTYFFLKGLQGEADQNSDRQLTHGELREYLSFEVERAARKLHNREQTPVFSGETEQVFSKY